MSFKNASQPIQKSVYNYSKSDYEYEVLTALIKASKMNRTIVATDIQQEPGKLRTVKLNIIPPQCDDGGDCSDSLCAPGTKIAPKQEYFQLSRCTASKVYSLAVNDARDLDNIGMNEYALSMISSTLTNVRKKLATEVATSLVAKAGLHSDGNSTKRLQLIDPSNGAPKPFGINEIKREFSDMQLGEPFVIGGYSAFHLRQGLLSGGLNAAGQNLGQVVLPNLYYDALINNVIGTGENLIAFEPDYVKFITWNKNEGRFATDLTSLRVGDMFKAGETYFSATIIDPVTKLLWDLDAVYIVCDKVWNFQFKLNWDLITLPATVCLNQNVNGILLYNGCELVDTPCPTVTPTPPPTPTVFSWTPSADELSEYIGTINIFGRSFEPQLSVQNINDWATLLNSLGVGLFAVVGADIRYTGYNSFNISYNNTETISFA